MLNDLITALLLALLGGLPLIFFGSIWLAVRYGPLRSRFWRGERWYGFAALVGLVSFLAGFVGPMVLAPGANQGPMLGLFITGPVGVIVGIVWGRVRAASNIRS
jgi:hypothetical protein